MDSHIVSICLFQQGGILVFIAQGPVLFLHFWFDLLFCVFVKLSPMEITHSFPIDHGFITFPTTIHNSNNIPIGLSVVTYEALEV
jgi:hypothetical protein